MKGSCLGRMWAWLVVAACVGVKEVWAACTMAQFPCRNQVCISLDQFCDGQQDCEDNSDEPLGCSPCNRTYYGIVGATYTLEIPQPTRGTLPHFCQLTFMASGDIYGDLVQLNIEKFSLGRFQSHTKMGCPDGYMQIGEFSKTPISGYWCGTSWGHNVFYSETSGVTIMLRVYNVSDKAPSYDPQDTIMLRLIYKFIKKDRAVLRYGQPYNPSYRGKDVANSFCDKYFENCDKKNCKIQSPNYPGMYPRNITCYYHVQQTRVPEGKVALIRIKQKNPHLIYIKDRNAPHLSKDRLLQIGDACHTLHDYLLVFDGNTTQSRALIKFCKGAELTQITSSGPDLLILFHASAFDYPFQDSPRRKVFGMELDVEVVFVDRESTAYIRNNTCEYPISSYGQLSGYLQSPAHSVLSNTTCTYSLLGSPGEKVWLYFLHYRQIVHREMPTPAQCTNTLTIHDGRLTKEQKRSTNTTILGQFCKVDKYPRVCNTVHSNGIMSKPCPPSESYISNTTDLTITLRYAAGTIPAHVEFLARYEFVSTRQWGDPMGPNPCDRLFTLRPDRLFASPRNVFFYGRGGAKKLKCVYTFRAEPHQRIALKILRSKMGNTCGTVYRHSTRKNECSHGGTGRHPSIWITEHPWPGVELTRACVCNTTDLNPFHVISYTNQIQLNFSIPYMTPAEDYEMYFFEGEYDIIDKTMCNSSSHRHMTRNSNFTFTVRPGDACATFPHLVHNSDNSYLFMRIAGFNADEHNCGVASRINVYPVGALTPIASICPEKRDGSVSSVFSSGWETPTVNPGTHAQNASELDMTIGFGRDMSGFNTFSHRPRQASLPNFSRDLLVEYEGNHTGRFLVTWVGVWRPLHTPTISSPGADLCPHRCPEIEACLPPELWCDGQPHCPSGLDEGTAACGMGALPWVYLGSGAVMLLSMVFLLIAVILHKRKMRAKKTDTTEMTSNNHHALKGNNEEFILPVDKESVL
ncbi:uncharacterized protein LOC143040299 [Oratosquilla oratoria]|uniref:uncharacterized protein LOC143040299 n=1 Tax=Oratosquilla oratoria TaxID=337810 RepID=UPI003F772E39